MKIKTIVRTIREGTFWQVVRQKLYIFFKQIGKEILWLLCMLFVPIKKNKIIFFNVFGKGLGDNPKYIALDLLKEKKYDLVWLGNDPGDSLPEEVRFVRFDSLQCYYEFLTSKVHVYNIRNYHPYKKRRGQIYLQTWHGGFCFKKIEKSAESMLSPEYVRLAKYDGQVCDGIIVDSKFTEDVFVNDFWLSPQVDIIRSRMPRSTILFEDNRSTKERIFHDLHLDQNAYIVLYAPTFRDDGSVDAYDLDYQHLISIFEKKEKKKCQMIIRMHPNVWQSLAINYSDVLIDGSHISDPMLLSICSNCIISDYSSFPFDFYFMKKPGYLYVKDEEAYIELRGGFYDLYNECPFPKAYSQDELEKMIMLDSNEQMTMRYDIFKEKYEDYGPYNFNQWISDRIER